MAGGDRAGAGDGCKAGAAGRGGRAGALSGLETGLNLIWQAAGKGEPETTVSADQAGLAWSPARLSAPPGLVRWARRGADVPDNWDLPDPARATSFALEADFGGGFEAHIVTSEVETEWPPGALALRIAETGPDGRTGRWLSILAGSPYL